MPIISFQDNIIEASGGDLILKSTSNFIDCSGLTMKNVTFDELISKSDIISFHCKAAPDGKPLITKEHYKKMKPTL